MTPSAATPAARATRSQPRPKTAATRPAGGRGPGHRSSVSRSSAPRAPRRISGPTAAAAAAAVAIPVAPPAPARPARNRPESTRRTPTRRAPRPAPAAPRRRSSGTSARPINNGSLAARAAAYLRALPDHRLLDRVVRGRAWIPLLGVLLVGIVAMQVEVLKLNAGIGHSIQQTTALQTRNQTLESAVARASDDQRIESAAARLGMVMPAPAAIRFLANDAAAIAGRALASIQEPDATTFANIQAAATAAAGSAGSEIVTPTPPGTPADASAISTGN